ncbi:MAG: hypothetical protein WAV20_22545 [Blastocatellia bacterium]
MDQINSTDSLTSREPSNLGSSGGGSTLDTIKETVADKLQAAAGVIQDRAGQNQSSPAAGYANKAAGWLGDTADYVRQVDPQQVKSDIQNQVRRNPGRSLLIAGAAGLLLGALLRR